MSAASQRAAFEPLAAEVLMFAGDGIIAADENDRILLFNRAAEVIFGYSADEVLGLPIEAVMAEPFRRPRRERVRRSAQELEPEWGAPGRRRRMAGQRKDGRRFPIEATTSRRYIHGQSVFIAVVRDASERERRRDTERLRARELEHRVKNVLATVQAMAMQTLQASASPEAFNEAFSSRLAALARAHAMVMQDYRSGVPLHELIAQQLAPYRSAHRERVVLAGAAVALRPAAALSLNLVLHELTTNAVKHGALSVPEGRVDVGWQLEASGPRRLVLVWAEAGGPEARPPERRGFGCQLIEHSIAYELGGTLRLEFPPEGVRCRVEIPLEPGPAMQQPIETDLKSYRR